MAKPPEGIRTYLLEKEVGGDKAKWTNEAWSISENSLGSGPYEIQQKFTIKHLIVPFEMLN